MIFKEQKNLLPVKEFIALMASMMALVALSIDAVLPALNEIINGLSILESNNAQLIISILFLGLAIGQIIFGTLSDFIGRKPAVSIGILIFVLGCLISFFSNTLFIMLIGRLLQGIGLSGPRIISVALIRDQYEGAAMARIMSLIMSIFIIVPAIAPLLGECILFFMSWRYIFIISMLVGLIVLLWFVMRQPETLKLVNRKRFSIKSFINVIYQIISNRVSLGYTIVAGLVSGMFLGFLSSIQPIFFFFNNDNLFAIGFAVLALFIGCASLVNAKLVRSFKIELIVKTALKILSIVSICFLLLSLITTLNFWLVMTFLMLSLFCIGILFGNLNTLAMSPLGEFSGIGSSIVGSLSTFISVPFGILIGFLFNNTIVPVALCFLAFSLLSLLVVYWINKSNKSIKIVS